MGMSALPGFGSNPVIGLEANEHATAAAKQRAAQWAGEATIGLTSETEESRQFDERTATHAIGESEETCKFAPTQAKLAVKGADTEQKISMPMNRGLKEAIFRANQEWESYHREWLGSGTKKVAFGSGFVLKEYVPSHNVSHSLLRTGTNCQVA
jgi:hypothetical protein